MASSISYSLVLGLIVNLMLTTFFAFAVPISTLQQSETHTTSFRIAPASDNHIISNIVGFYENLKYDGDTKSEWRFVTISRVDHMTLRWKNRVGVQWTLKLQRIGDGENDYDRHVLLVQSDCPYFKEGHTKVSVVYNSDGRVKFLSGPFGEPYTRLRNSPEYLKNAIAGQYESAEWGIVSVTPLFNNMMEWKEEDSAAVKMRLVERDNGCDRDRFVFVPRSPGLGYETVYGKIVWSKDGMNVVAVKGPFDEQFSRVD